MYTEMRCAYLVTKSGRFHKVEWFTIHLDDAVALATMSNSCGSFLTKEGNSFMCQDTLPK